MVFSFIPPEYIDPILSNVAGSWFIARSAMEQVAFNCGTGGFERSDLRFYGARNLQGAEHLASDTVMAGERGALSQLPPALKVEVCAAG